MRYVGIDLHNRLLVACIVTEQSEIVATPRIEEVTRTSLHGNASLSPAPWYDNNFFTIIGKNHVVNY